MGALFSDPSVVSVPTLLPPPFVRRSSLRAGPKDSQGWKERTRRPCPLHLVLPPSVCATSAACSRTSASVRIHTCTYETSAKVGRATRAWGTVPAVGVQTSACRGPNPQPSSRTPKAQAGSGADTGHLWSCSLVWSSPSRGNVTPRWIKELLS